MVRHATPMIYIPVNLPLRTHSCPTATLPYLHQTKMSGYQYAGQEVNYQLIADIVQLLEENGIPCLLIGDYMHEAMGAPGLRGVSQLPDLI